MLELALIILGFLRYFKELVCWPTALNILSHSYSEEVWVCAGVGLCRDHDGGRCI